MRSLPILASVLLLTSPLPAADPQPSPFSGKIVSVSTGDEGQTVTMEKVSTVEIAGKKYLRGTAVKTDDDRYWYGGREVLVPESVVTFIVLFKDEKEYDEAMKRAEKGARAELERNRKLLDD